MKRHFNSLALASALLYLRTEHRIPPPSAWYTEATEGQIRDNLVPLFFRELELERDLNPYPYPYPLSFPYLASKTRVQDGRLIQG